VLRPGGRAVLAVWGERVRCGWAALFGIVDAEVRSEVCPLFFGLGHRRRAGRCCVGRAAAHRARRRRSDTLDYADAEEACAAAFVGGPVALAWSRFDDRCVSECRTRYIEAIAPWRDGEGYRVPAEYVIVAVQRPPT
jgi:hypothetical protein